MLACKKGHLAYSFDARSLDFYKKLGPLNLYDFHCHAMCHVRGGVLSRPARLVRESTAVGRLSFAQGGTPPTRHHFKSLQRSERREMGSAVPRDDELDPRRCAQKAVDVQSESQFHHMHVFCVTLAGCVCVISSPASQFGYCGRIRGLLNRPTG